MATLKERSDNWNATSIKTRDFRHTHDGGYEETKHKKVSKKVRAPKKKPGCPGNDGKSHIWVWIVDRWLPDAWTGQQLDRAYGPGYFEGVGYWTPWKTRAEHIDFLEKYESKVCCGCYKRPRYGKAWRRRLVKDFNPD